MNQVKITLNKIKKYRFVLAVIGALLLPQIVTNTYYVTMFCLALIYIIIAFGLNFITGMTGQMNLGTAGIYCLGAYTSALLTTKTGISPWLFNRCRPGLSQLPSGGRLPVPDDHRLR